MRLTTDIFVSSLTRRVFGEGGFAAVLRKGAAEAGAVFIIARERDGTATLYGPAAQTSYDEERPSERRFALLSQDEGTFASRLEKEARFDPDVWSVEIEPAQTAIGDLIVIDRTLGDR